MISASTPATATGVICALAPARPPASQPLVS
jgi:hypothetical protein